MRIEWQHPTITDIVSLILLLFTVLGVGFTMHEQLQQVMSQHSELEQKLDEEWKEMRQGQRILLRVSESQRDVVRCLREFPPHRHEGGRIVMPHELPEMAPLKESEDPPALGTKEPEDLNPNSAQ